MLINSIKEAKKLVGKKLYWDDSSRSINFLREGVLDEIFNNQISFDNSEDYQSLKFYNNLRTTKE